MIRRDSILRTTLCPMSASKDDARQAGDHAVAIFLSAHRQAVYIKTADQPRVLAAARAALLRPGRRPRAH